MKLDYLKQKHPGIYVLFKTVKKVLSGDKEYINDVITLHNNSDVLVLEHRQSMLPGKIVLEISEAGSGAGFFAEFKFLLEQLLYADMMGLVPKVCYTEKYLYYDEQLSCDKSNAFTYFFQDINADVDISKVMNCTKSGLHICQYIEKKYDSMSYALPTELKMELARMIKKYIVIQNKIKNEIDSFYERRFIGHRVLGVHYRGTDFHKGYNNHPVAVDVEQLIARIHTVMDKGQYDLIFLATDQQGVYEELRLHFSNCIIRFENVFLGNDNTSIAFSKSSRENHHYRLGEEVLKDTYMLSLCEGLVAGRSQVGLCAELFKLSRGETYQSYDLIDNGINHNSNFFEGDLLRKQAKNEKSL